MTGVDLTGIDGLNESSVLKILSETGADISSWPTEKHFCSWLGLSPGNKVTGGKILSGKTKPSANRAAAAFRLAVLLDYSIHRVHWVHTVDVNEQDWEHQKRLRLPHIN